VIPSAISERLSTGIGIQYLFFGMVMMALTQTAIGYLGRENGYLLPNYYFPHLFVSISLTCCVSMFAIWMCYEEAFHLSAVTISFLFPFTGVTLVVYLMTRKPMAMVLMPIIVACPYVGFILRPEFVWRFHLGLYPEIETLLWGVMALSVVSFPFFLPRAIKAVRESELGELITSQNMNFWQQREKLRSTTEKKTRQRSRIDTKLLKKIASCVQFQNFSTRLALWRSANPYIGVHYVMVAAIFFIFFDTIFWQIDLGEFTKTWNGPLLIGLIIGLTVFLPIDFVAGLSIVWKRRLKVIPTESLFPVRRHEFRRMLTTAMFADSLPVSLVTLCLTGWICFRLDVALFQTPSGILTVLFFTTACCLFLTVLSLLIVLMGEKLKRLTGLRYLILRISFGLIPVGVYFVFKSLWFSKDFSLTQELITEIGLGVIVLTTLLFAWTWKELNRKEWGLV